MRFTIDIDTLPEVLTGSLRAGTPFVFTEAEAAEFLRLKKSTLATLRRSGKIAHCRIVKDRVRYTLDDLREYLARGHRPIEVE